MLRASRNQIDRAAVRNSARRWVLCCWLALAGACTPPTRSLSAQLIALSPGWARAHADTFDDILLHALSVDDYVCEPEPDRVFFGATEPGVRLIDGSLPHYDLYRGPMRYQVTRKPNRWMVRAWLSVEPPEVEGRLELPDCSLKGVLDGPVTCSGRAYSASGTLDICPGSGHFSAPVTLHNVERLLDSWSAEVERYYNRDAAARGLPIHYDFEFALAGESPVPPAWALSVPLATTCARTPYFQAVRSGWSLPILAHEIGHLLGLLDEYEMFSGIVSVYPKTAFPGAERSRMGWSMKEGSQLLPLHHYLILRRYFCPNPEPPAAAPPF